MLPGRTQHPFWTLQSCHRFLFPNPEKNRSGEMKEWASERDFGTASACFLIDRFAAGFSPLCPCQLSDWHPKRYYNALTCAMSKIPPALSAVGKRETPSQHNGMAKGSYSSPCCVWEAVGSPGGKYRYVWQLNSPKVCMELEQEDTYYLVVSCYLSSSSG